MSDVLVSLRSESWHPFVVPKEIPLSKEPPSKLGGIQDLEIQCELFGIMLILDISTNHLSRDVVPYTGDPHHMVFEIVDSTSGPLETHASKNTKFSPLRGLAPFLPPASWGVSRSSFL